MQDSEIDLRMKIAKYEDILTEIASASEQANPKHLIDRAKMTLSFYAEKDIDPTTADEFNVPVITGDKDTDALLEDERIAQDENLKSQQEMLDRHRDMQAEIVEYDKKLSEIADEEFKGTVLDRNYKSPFDEEE